MKIYHTVLWILCAFYIRESACLLDPLTGTAVVGAGVGIYYGYLKCYMYECCTADYIPQDLPDLKAKLNDLLFGQKLATNLLIDALRAHTTRKASKALTMAFHGPPGTGKNYVAAMIRDAFYKKGISSQYFHFFRGRSDFPLEQRKKEYQEKLQKIIANALYECPKSMFVFDEVDDMTEGVLDALVPFMDYGPTQFRIDSKNKVIETREAIFIFLCNTGSLSISEKLTEMWLQGKSRDEASPVDFDRPISIEAFNVKGGFYKSDAIQTSLIDHYVPFLPLEKEHIKLCIQEVFSQNGISEPTHEQIEEVMSFVTFGPEPHNLFSENGCKRLDSKILSIVYRRSNKI